jgi:hypothetical protein
VFTDENAVSLEEKKAESTTRSTTATKLMISVISKLILDKIKLDGSI